MSAPKSGGPAFPSEQYGAFDDSCKGMTLRDYFAAKAMQGILAGGFADTIPHDNLDADTSVASFAYMYADAMLAARED